MEGNDEEYREVIREFYKTYEPLQKRYNLRMNSHASIYDDAIIEIWEYEGEVRGKRICRTKEEDETTCYIKATNILKSYGEKKEHEKKQDKKPLRFENGKNAVGLAGENSVQHMRYQCS